MTTTPPTITLAYGERYIGGIISADGTTTHIILLPGSTKATWKKAMTWAEEVGGDLPNRIEQAMVFATAKDEFEEAAYWSNTEVSSESGWAWYQSFSSGGQTCSTQSYALRARAVRRLII